MDAKITGPDGQTFAATIANLTRASVFVQCDAVLPFRAAVTVAFEDIELRGEVGFVSREPAGVVVAFEVPALYRITLGALIENVPVLSESPWVEHTQPTPDDEPEPVTLGHVAQSLVAAAPAELAEELDVGDLDAEATSPWEPTPAARSPVVMPLVSDLGDLAAPARAARATSVALPAQVLAPPAQRASAALTRGIVADLGAPSTLPPPALDPSLLLEASPLPPAVSAPMAPRVGALPPPPPRAAALPVPTPPRGTALEPVETAAPRTSVHLPASRGPIPRSGSTALPPLPGVARGVPPPRAATSSGRAPAAGLPSAAPPASTLSASGPSAAGLPAGLVAPTLSGPSTTGVPTPASGIVLASGLPAPSAGVTTAPQRLAGPRAASVSARAEPARPSTVAPAPSPGVHAPVPAASTAAHSSAPARTAQPSAPAAPAPPAPRAPSVAAPAAGSTPSTLPTLAEGIVQFARAADFAAEFRANLQHGGIIARSTPLSIGSMHALRLVVPGVRETIQLRARVGFLGEGTVGFMIDSFPLERPRIEAALSEAAAAAPAR